MGVFDQVAHGMTGGGGASHYDSIVRQVLQLPRGVHPTQHGLFNAIAQQHMEDYNPASGLDAPDVLIGRNTRRDAPETDLFDGLGLEILRALAEKSRRKTRPQEPNHTAAQKHPFQPGVNAVQSNSDGGAFLELNNVYSPSDILRALL